jgi:flagellar hook-associated protein 3 FlgL
MRITFNSFFRDGLRSLQTTAADLLRAQRQVSSGKRVSRGSDDPSAAVGGLANRAELATVQRYEKAADTVYSRLTVVDTVLSDVIDKLTAAQTAIVSAQGSVQTDAQREAAAQNLEGIRSAIVDDLNTSFNGTFLFAGAKSTTQPFTVGTDGTVSAYAGSATEVEVDINRRNAVTVVLNGEQITKGSAATDVFATLDDAIAAARAGDSAALDTAMVGIKAAFERATTAQSQVGNDMRSIDGEKLRLQEMRIAAMTRVSDLEDANMAEAISDMSRADTAYKAALGAMSTSNRVSLLDYLG